MKTISGIIDIKTASRESITLTSKFWYQKRWMPKNGWFYLRDQNFDMENEAHRKTDDYPHTQHPDDQ